jgi:peroxiredoxin
MKNIKCFLFAVLVASFANTSADVGNFNLSISTDGKIILQRVQLLNADGYNNTITESGKEFVFSNTVNRYGQYTLSVSYMNQATKKKGDVTFQLFLKAGDTKLVFQGTAGKYNLTGASATSQKDFEAFNTKYQVYLQKVLMFITRLNQYQQSGNKIAANQIKDSVSKAESARKEMLESFIRKHPNSDLSLYVMGIYSYVNQDIPEEVISLLSTLGKELQQTDEMMAIRKTAEENKNFIKGAKAPDFTQTDTSGVAITLSSLQGKYVLIDFWASWCKPCRAQNPSMVRLYQKYKNKGFTILGVSLDAKKEAWLKAIHDDKLEWQHVSDLKFWSNAVAKQYKITSVPQNFLLDPKGVIIGKNLSEDDLDQLLEKELVKLN